MKNKIIKAQYKKTLIPAFSLALVLSGCEMYAPSTVNETRIQVVEQSINHDVLTRDMTDTSLSALAQDYNNRGGAPMDLVVTYDPKSRRNTAMIAGDNAAKFSKTLRIEGVQLINARILPIKDQGDESRVMVTYQAMTALAPKGCKDMPGMNTGVLEVDQDYRLGCGVDTLIAKQVARPSDLLGRGVADYTTDGRAAANVIEAYRTGARNEKLDGQQASDE